MGRHVERKKIYLKEQSTIETESHQDVFDFCEIDDDPHLFKV